MKLYHLTALASTSRRIVLEGAFTAPKQQEIVTGTASTLELYRLVPKESRLRPLFQANLFATILNLASFRLPEMKRDFLLVTSDAGALTILIADEATSTFKRIHCEALGKTGMRRVVPGLFLASDPRGRACMVAALEKVKLCFVLNRDTEENLTISSALEANKTNTVTYAIVSVDVGFENPVFAALEQSYDHGSSKQLIYYELDLGLNHVSRKAMSPVRDSTLTMIPVPGHDRDHQDGPGGVLLIGVDHFTYCNLLADNGKTEKLECRMPYRRGANPCDGTVVSSTMYHDKKRKAFFFMMCTENGDMIKADIEWNVEEGATQLRVAYFDSIPAPATSMSILRAGFLYISMEGNDAALFRFENVDVKEDDPAGGYSWSNYVKVGDHVLRDSEAANGDKSSSIGESQKENGTQTLSSKLEFCPRSVLKNLTKVETHPALTSLLDAHLTRDTLGYPLVLTASGRGKCAKFSAVRRGIGLNDISSPVKLPFRAESVFTFGDHVESQYDRFILVSSLTQTMVLRVQDGTILESPDSGFEQARATVFAGVMSNSSFVQIHVGGVRFIPNGNIDEATEWKPPADLRILAGSGNRSQLVISLSSGTLVYFEVDDESGYLTEVDQVQRALAKTDADDGHLQTIPNVGRTALVSIQETPPGRKKASYFAAADGITNRARLFRITKVGSIELLGLQIAPAQICSLALVDLGTISAFDDKRRSVGGKKPKERKQKDRDGRMGYEPMICLVSGTLNGVVTQAMVDANTGDLSGKRTTLVGLGPVRTATFRIQNISVCLLLSSRSLLLRKQGGMIMTLPLLTSPIHHAASFLSPSFVNGIITVTGATLRLVAFDSKEMFSLLGISISSLSPPVLPTTLNLDLSYNMDRVALLGTPRRIIPLTIKPSSPNQEGIGAKNGEQRAIQAFVLLQTDLTKALPEQRKEVEGRDSGSPTAGHPDGTTQSTVSAIWHSAIQVFNVHGQNLEDALPGSLTTPGSGESALTPIDSIHLPNSDAIIDGAATTFNARGPNEEAVTYLVLSTARPQGPSFPSGQKINDGLKSGCLFTYIMDPSTCKLRLLHDTSLPEPAHAIKPFRDMIAVGCGRSLELYSLGKKKLLKKAECKYAVANKIVSLAIAGSDRVFIGDIRESVTVYKYICNGQNHLREDFHQPQGGRFVALGSDSVPRWITSMVLLDYNSVACGDKFGNLFVLRLSKSGSSGSGSTMEVSGLELVQSAVGMKKGILVTEASIHVGSTVTGLTLGSFGSQLVSAREGTEHFDDAILFGTIDGSLGILVPLRRQSDMRLASSVEAMMRKQQFSVCGRDHIAFRSSFGPVKNVIDGDLCEMFDSLTWDKKVEFAGQIGRSVKEVLQKLEELRSSVM